MGSDPSHAEDPDQEGVTKSDESAKATSLGKMLLKVTGRRFEHRVRRCSAVPGVIAEGLTSARTNLSSSRLPLNLTRAKSTEQNLRWPHSHYYVWDIPALAILTEAQCSRTFESFAELKEALQPMYTQNARITDIWEAMVGLQ